MMVFTEAHPGQPGNHSWCWVLGHQGRGPSTGWNFPDRTADEGVSLQRGILTKEGGVTARIRRAPSGSNDYQWPLTLQNESQSYSTRQTTDTTPQLRDFCQKCGLESELTCSSIFQCTPGTTLQGWSRQNPKAEALLLLPSKRQSERGKKRRREILRLK